MLTKEEFEQNLTITIINDSGKPEYKISHTVYKDLSGISDCTCSGKVTAVKENLYTRYRNLYGFTESK